MIAPGVAAAALLAAAISVDDYVITSFNAGQTITFPLFIFGATRQGVPPEVNVLATGLLLIVLVLMALNVMLQRRLARRDAARQAVAATEHVLLKSGAASADTRGMRGRWHHRIGTGHLLAAFAAAVPLLAMAFYGRQRST